MDSTDLILHGRVKQARVCRELGLPYRANGYRYWEPKQGDA
jgi:hypothetical protein